MPKPDKAERRDTQREKNKKGMKIHSRPIPPKGVSKKLQQLTRGTIHIIKKTIQQPQIINKKKK